MILVKLDGTESIRNLGVDTDFEKRVLTTEDIILIVKYLIGLINSKAVVDDIDHLSNRRVRTVGEQLYHAIWCRSCPDGQNHKGKNECA